MSSAPVQDIDLKTFESNPYPILGFFRTNSPITYVPQLNATLFSNCLLYTSPSPRDQRGSGLPASA